jgi:hypothetical protein
VAGRIASLNVTDVSSASPPGVDRDLDGVGAPVSLGVVLFERGALTVVDDIDQDVQVLAVPGDLGRRRDVGVARTVALPVPELVVRVRADEQHVGVGDRTSTGRPGRGPPRPAAAQALNGSPPAACVSCHERR